MSIVLLLAVLGIALVMLAIWLFRLTRPDKELLAPLEVMGERKWRRADPVWQRRRLDEVRPGDAQPLQPSAAPPDFDEAFFDQRPAAAGFDDLHDDAHANGDSPPRVERAGRRSRRGRSTRQAEQPPEPDANGTPARRQAGAEPPAVVALSRCRRRRSASNGRWICPTATSIPR